MSEYRDYSTRVVMIGISEGINSATVLINLAKHPEEYKPKLLLLFCAHFVNHSPDSLQFGIDCISYAVKNFSNIKIKVTWNDVLEFFKSQHTIPHPSNSPCSRQLKHEPMEEFGEENDVNLDLIGYVKEEIRRRLAKHDYPHYKKLYPIGDISNEECFDIVKKEIGWYPAIYDLRCGKDGLCKTCKKKQARGLVQLGCGGRIFKHNNCLPCKNGEPEDFENWKQFYPNNIRDAIEVSNSMGVYWGRNKEVNMCRSCEFD